MIIDCYTHTWESTAQLGRGWHRGAAGPGMLPIAKGSDPWQHATLDRHWEACEPCDCALVIGFASRFLEAGVTNDHVAQYVGLHPGRLIAFAGIDPSDWRSAIDELRRARFDLGMHGAAVAPCAQDFHPSDSKAMLVYRQAAELRMPLIFHIGPYLASSSKLEYARPFLLDEVARELPDLNIVIAHLGYPWVQETCVLLAKHPHVYADISCVLYQPWQAYQALVLAYQHGVMNKLLFASGFPFASAAQSIEMLYGVNHVCQGTNLPPIPRRDLRGIVERDSLALLGIEFSNASPARPPASRTPGRESELHGIDAVVD